MKPDDLTWHEYLKGYSRLRWRSPGDERRFHAVCGLLQPLHALRYGNLLDRTGPKVVIPAPAPTPVQAEGTRRGRSRRSAWSPGACCRRSPTSG